MKKIEDPKFFTRTALAQQSFSWALSLFPLVKQQKETETRAILFGAICIYYSRPFTNNKGFGMISDDVIPDHMKTTHQQVIDYRNTIIAHSDINEEVNRLYFRSDGQRVLLENRHKSPSNEHLNDVENLIRQVSENAKVSMDNCLNEGELSKLQHTAGLYQLSVSDPQVWLEEVEDDGLGDT